MSPHRRHADVADIEQRLKRRGDRAEAATTLLFSVFLSVILTLSVVHWLELGADEDAAPAAPKKSLTTSRAGGAA